MAYRKDWGQPQAGGQGFARTRKVIGRVVNIGVADNVSGNTVGAFLAPKDFVVTGITAVITDMDSGATMTLSIGDAASGVRFLAATSGQAASTATTLPAAGLYYQFPADTEVLVTIVAQATTPLAGTVTVYMEGFIGP